MQPAKVFWVVTMILYHFANSCVLNELQLLVGDDGAGLGAAVEFSCTVLGTYPYDFSYGDWLVGGAPDYLINHRPAGAVYVYPGNPSLSVSPWDSTKLRKLQCPTATSGGSTQSEECGINANFGYDVAITPNPRHIVVGNPVDHSNGDSQAYIYKLIPNVPWQTSMWVFSEKLQKITAGPVPTAQFGTSVDINMVFAVVGDPGADCVYIYQYDGTAQWNYFQAIKGPVGSTFGTSVAMLDFPIGGNTHRLVIGSPGTNEAYVYESVNGASFSLLPANPLVPKNSLGFTVDRFGQDVDISPQRILVGAPGNPTSNGKPTQGVAFLYYKQATSYVFVKAAGLENPEAQTFGYSVGVDDFTESIAVGAPRKKGSASNNAENVGAAYLYSSPDGCYLGDVCIKDGNAQDRFGTALDLNFNNLAVGAPRKDKGSNGGGSTNAGLIGFYNAQPVLDQKLILQPLYSQPKYGPCIGGSIQYDISCYGVSDGRVVVQFSGPRSSNQVAYGHWTYYGNSTLDHVTTYNIATPSATVYETGLASGTWSLQIARDGCLSNIQQITLVAPYPIVITANPTCMGATSTVDIYISGGCADYQITALNSASTLIYTSGCVSTFPLTIALPSGTTGTITIKATAYCSIAGPSTPCSASTTFTVPTTIAVNTPTVVPRACNGNSYGVSCFGATNGAATVYVSGCSLGTFSYQWKESGGAIISGTATGPQSISTNSLPAGTWTFSATFGGTTAVTSPFAITSPAQLVANAPIPQLYGCNNYQSCSNIADGMVSASFSGGCGKFAVFWYRIPFNGSPIISAINTTTLSNLFPSSSNYDSYYYTVSDSCGSQITSPTVVFNKPQSRIQINEVVTCTNPTNNKYSISVDGSTGGCGPLSYTWIGPTCPCTGSVLTNVPAGDYVVTASDSNGCSAVKTITIEAFSWDNHNADFDKWGPEVKSGSGDWVVSNSGKTVTQIQQDFSDLTSNPSFYYSPLSLSSSSTLSLDGLVTVMSMNDQDYFGFAFGIPEVDFTYGNVPIDFILIDWKGNDEIIPGMGTADQGLAIWRLTSSTYPSREEFWTHSSAAGFTLLGRGTTLGNSGWSSQVTYEFHLEWSSNSIRVYVDQILQLDVYGTFPVGVTGFYTFSQDGVQFDQFNTDTVYLPTCGPAVADIQQAFVDPCGQQASDYTVTVNWGDGMTYPPSGTVSLSFDPTTKQGIVSANKQYTSYGEYFGSLCILRSGLNMGCEDFKVVVASKYFAYLPSGQWRMYLPQPIYWFVDGTEQSTNTVRIEWWQLVGSSYVYEKTIIDNYPITNGFYQWKPYNTMPGEKLVKIYGLQSLCYFQGNLNVYLHIR